MNSNANSIISKADVNALNNRIMGLSKIGMLQTYVNIIEISMVTVALYDQQSPQNT